MNATNRKLSDEANVAEVSKSAAYWAAQGKSWEWFTMRCSYAAEFFSSEQMDQVWDAFVAAGDN
jgi:hypothetical protein